MLARPDLHVGPCCVCLLAALTAQVRTNKTCAVLGHSEGMTTHRDFFLNTSILRPSSLVWDLYIAKVSLICLPPLWAVHG